MHIETASSRTTRTFSLDELSREKRDKLQIFQSDTAHNVYFTPGVAPWLRQQGLVVPALRHTVTDTRTVYYAAKAPVGDKGLLGDKGRTVLNIADLVTGSAAAPLWTQYAPDVAGIMPEVNVFVGVIGCYDKLSRTGLQKRIGGGLCFADMAVKTLLLLGHVIPGLAHIANHLIVVQLVIKAGDKITELSFSAKDKAGQDILKAVEVSVSKTDLVLFPANSLGTLVTNGSGAPTFARGAPPES